MGKKIIISETDLKKLIGNLITEQSSETYQLDKPTATIKSVGGFVYINDIATCVAVKKGDTMFAQGIKSVTKNGNNMIIHPNVGWMGSAAGYDKINMVQSEVIDMVNKINAKQDYVKYKDGAKITIAARLIPWCKKNFK